MRSAKTSSSNGRKNQRHTSPMVLPMLLLGMCPMSSLLMGPCRLLPAGRSLCPHFLIMVPSFRSRSPGLLRMMVLSVVSSVMKNGYSAPVMFSQC